MDELAVKRFVHFVTKPRNVNVHHVVESRSTCALLPYVACQHLARNDLFFVSKQIFEKFELASCEFQLTSLPSYFAGGQIHFKVIEFQWKRMISPPAAEQRSHARQKFWECEGLHKVIISTLIQTSYPVFDGIPRREDKNWCLHAALSKRRQHLQAVATRKHEIQNDKIELLGVYQEEPLLSGRSKDDLVFLALQSFPECMGD